MGYFRSNREHMNYGIFAGSGVIEAGVKVIVDNRMKNAGMHWSKDHAEKMIALRCAICGEREMVRFWLTPDFVIHPQECQNYSRMQGCQYSDAGPR